MYKWYRSLLVNRSLTLIIIRVMLLNHFSALSWFINLEPLEWSRGQVIHEERFCLRAKNLHAKCSSLAFPEKNVWSFLKVTVHFRKRNNSNFLGFVGHLLWTDLNSWRHRMLLQFISQNKGLLKSGEPFWSHSFHSGPSGTPNLRWSYFTTYECTDGVIHLITGRLPMLVPYPMYLELL